MKTSFFILILSSIYLISCKEQIPNGLVLNSITSVDTSYIASVETPQEKIVLIEELTGASCTNCPKGTKILKDFMTQYPGRIIVTALHTGILTQPPPGALYDFRNADADLILSFLENEVGKPSASFDRVRATTGTSAGKYFILKGQSGGDWISTLPERLVKTTPVNIHLTSSLNSTTNNVDVKVKIAFTSAVSEQLALSLFVLENGRVDIQEDTDLGEIPNYVFNHIFRKAVTPIGGELILDSLTTKTAGRVLEKNISFTPFTTGINGWNLDSCVLVGVIHKTGASKEVLHAEEVHLK